MNHSLDAVVTAPTDGGLADETGAAQHYVYPRSGAPCFTPTALDVYADIKEKHADDLAFEKYYFAGAYSEAAEVPLPNGHEELVQKDHSCWASCLPSAKLFFYTCNSSHPHPASP
jgi:hypothetical protein